jgi:two-component system response regulator YesN
MFTILIVDDNRSDRVGLKDLVKWEQLGIKVVDLAVNGVQGIEKAILHKPDFILTDVAMPLMDGLKMAEKISINLPDTKFIFMSCFDEFKYVKKAMTLKAYGYVLKPIGLEELTSVLVTMTNVKQDELEKIKNDMKLKERIAESIALLKEQFFRSLLYGKFGQDSDIQDNIRFLNIDIKSSFYTIIYIKIDDYDVLYPDIQVEQRFSIIFNIRKKVEDIVLKKINGHIIDQQYVNLAVILFPAGNTEECMDAMIQVLLQLKDSLNRILEMHVTIGIGNLSNSLVEVPQIYEEAEYAAKYKFYSEGNRIILASEVKSNSSVMHVDTQKMKLELEKIIEQGDSGSIKVFIDEYYNTDMRCSEANIKEFSYNTISVLQSILIERNESFGNIFDNETPIWNRLDKTETIVQIKQFMEMILEEIRLHLITKEDSRYLKIVNSIKGFIDANYVSIKNIDDIVRSFYISGNYANVIFKKHIGITVFDYLVSVRIKKAKELLADSYVKIYEVAEKVGYKSKSYFTAVFKESTGMTPKQYSNKQER